MKFLDIVDAIKANSAGINKSEIVDGLLSPLCDAFDIRNKYGNKYQFDVSSRASALLTSDSIPLRLVLEYTQPDFSEALENAVGKFLNGYPQELHSENLISDLCTLCKLDPDSYDGETYERLRMCLIDCLKRYFAKKYGSTDRGGRGNSIKSSNISIFVTLVKGMVDVNRFKENQKRNLQPYTMEEKLDLNRIEGPLREKMLDSFDTNFDCIEKALKQLSNFDPNIRTRFRSVVSGYYSDYLVKHDLRTAKGITDQARSILDYAKGRILTEIEDKQVAGIYQEELENYAFALVVYVFYECGILIPVGKKK